MPTKVLVFESDAAFAEELRSELSRLDCEVNLVDDASVGLQTAARDRPDLILLAIELPRMNGFSVCNKLKRDPGLKDVPLVIMSSDSSEETFEQHRRLRTRAEDYVHKPVAFAELLGRIQAFVPIGKNDAEPDGPLSDDAIVIEDDIMLEEAAVEIADAEVDLETEKQTDAAFDSIVEAPRPSEPIEAGIEITDAEVMSAPPPSGGAVVEALDLEITDEEVHNALSEHPPRVSSAAPPLLTPPPSALLASVAPGARSSTFPERNSARPGSLAPRSSDLELARMAGDVERHRSRAQELEEDLRAAQTRLTELEDVQRRASSAEHDVQRLERELEDVKSRLTSGKASGTAREFLDLREQLNKKDKELIDLRDQLTHRDKELVAARDASFELERRNADQTDRISELDKQNVEFSRNNEVLRTDKEAASKRAEDFKRKSEKLKTDLDAKLVEAAELKAQLDAEMEARTVREAELEARAQSDLEKAVLATEASERERAERNLAEARAAAAAELESSLNSERERAAQQLSDAVNSREANLLEQHNARIASFERANEETLLKLRAEHEQTLVDAAASAASALLAREGELHTQRQQELARASDEHLAKLASLEAAQVESLAQRDGTIGGLERDLTQRTNERDEARRDVDRRKLRIEGLETDISTTREALESARATVNEQRATIESTQQALNQKLAEAEELSQRLNQTQTSLANLEVQHATQSGELQQTQTALANDRGVLERAREKRDHDRASLERAKDALAAALQQVDEIEGRTFD
ncbi:MAG: response regulator [Polyangiaceae bacterium]